MVLGKRGREGVMGVWDEIHYYYGMPCVVGRAYRPFRTVYVWEEAFGSSMIGGLLQTH